VKAVRGLKKDFIRNWQLYLLLLIPFTFLIVFNYVPIYGLQIAFKRFNGALGIWGSPWVGFEQFKKFFSTYYFQRVLTNTFFIGLYSLLAGFPFSIIFALALNATQYLRFKKAVQMITYAPYFISTVVMVGLINQLFSTHYGMFNQFRELFGMEKITFLNETSYFIHIYVWSGIWQGLGWGSIIYLAALSGVDSQLHEAAIVDGASVFQRIVHIDIPGITPTIVLMLILNSGSILSVGFEKIYLMQNPINLPVSEVISTYIYKEGLFANIPNYSYSTAVGLFNTVICFIILVIVNQVSKKVSETSLW